MLYKDHVKRVLDVALSSVALAGLSPLLLVTAGLVRAKLGSPVLFRQERIGKVDPKTGEVTTFSIFKFRTMTDEKDSTGKMLPDTERLTRFGRILRSTSIDELPELINIFRGDMSIVGPRPLPVLYLPFFTTAERRRFEVRPGLTGWAQVNGRNSISWDNKFKYDVEYVGKISFPFDADIVLRTVKKVFVREGIGQGEEHPGSLHEIRASWLDENGKIKAEYDLPLTSASTTTGCNRN